MSGTSRSSYSFVKFSKSLLISQAILGSNNFELLIRYIKLAIDNTISKYISFLSDWNRTSLKGFLGFLI